MLLKPCSRKACMTCHWFWHHAGVNCIPAFAYQLHQSLIAHGEYLTHCCQGWTVNMVRQRAGRCSPAAGPKG